MPEFTSSQVIIAAVFGSSGIIAAIVAVAKLLLDRNEKKADKKQAELESHITSSAEMRRLDDLKADKLYERQVEINENLERKIEAQRTKVGKYRRLIKLCKGQCRNVDKQSAKILDMLEFGFQTKDVKPQVVLLLSDINRLAEFLEQDPEELVPRGVDTE